MRKNNFFLYVLGAAMVLIWQPQPANSAQDSDQLAAEHFKKAIGMVKRTNYLEAIAEYEKVIGLLPDSEIALDARYWIGQSYFRMGRHDEAMSVFKKLIKEYPGSAIAPVAKLMVARVEKDIEIGKIRAKRDADDDKTLIIDPETGAQFRRIAVHTGKKDVVEVSRGLKLSPNGRFLLNNDVVIPFMEGEPFDLMDGKTILRGVWSPDGRTVAYYSEDSIWIVPVSQETGRPTGPAKKLLDGEYRYQNGVSWSPDSAKIAFLRRDEKTDGDIWTLSIKDGTLNRITEEPGYESKSCWSPDGKTIAYKTRGTEEEIRLVPAEGGQSKKIIGMEYGRLRSWSPDGEWLVYDMRQKLHLYRLADKRTFALDPPKEVGDFFSWSKDGEKMLFYRSSYNWTSTLRAVSTSGGPSFRLSRNLELWPFSQFWTSESRTIITSRAGDSKFMMIPLAGGESIPIELEVSTEDDLNILSLSPDRKSLLCSIELKSGNENLYTIPVSLEEARTTGPAVVVFRDWDRRITRSQSSWSPDGRNIAMIHKADIWVTSADREKPVRITKTEARENGPAWSPGGKRIAYIRSIEAGQRNLMVVPSTGGEPVELFDNFETFCWHPGGKEITLISKNKILNIPSAGGPAKAIFDLEGKGFTDRFWGLEWLPEGKRITFVGEKEKSSSSQIYVASIATGEIMELAADDESWKDGIFPSPDGKWISYYTDGFVKTRSQSTIWEVDVEELIEVKKK